MICLHTVNGVEDGIWEVDRNIFSDRYFRQLNQAGLRSLHPAGRSRPTNRPRTESCSPHLLHILPLAGSRRQLGLPLGPAVHVHLDQRFLQVGNVSLPGFLGLSSHLFPQRLEECQILLPRLRHVPYNNISNLG